VIIELAMHLFKHEFSFTLVLGEPVEASDTGEDMSQSSDMFTNTMVSYDYVTEPELHVGNQPSKYVYEEDRSRKGTRGSRSIGFTRNQNDVTPPPRGAC
jgi:hypothetical protein